MSEPKKTIVYVDVNDEITSIITKVQDAPARIVAVVLPKRAPAFQSVINLKLLKKAADKAKKKTVLITSDKAILPLAGAAGVHVARTTESRPYIPDAPKATPKSEVSTDEDAPDPSKPIGELARNAAEKEEAIDLGDLPKIDIDDEEADAKKKTKKKKRPGIKVPNFNKFRLWIILGAIGLVLLIVGWYVAAFVLPRAEITVETRAQNVAETLEFDIRTGQEEIDEENFVIPAVELEYTLEDSATVETSGEENRGDRAEGEVTVVNCEPQQITIERGTALTASDGTVFRSDETVTIDPSNRVPPFRVQDCQEDESEDIDVVADEPGADYNIRSTNYTVAGYSSNSVYGSGGSMEGGTDDIVSIVTSGDIRAAQDEIDEQNIAIAESELEAMHEIDGLLPITETINAGDEDINTSPDLGDEGDEVTVMLSTNYTMLGVDREDVRRLLEIHIGDEFDLERQTIIDDGLDDASIRVVQQEGDTTTIRLRTIAAIGPDIDIEELKELVAGSSRSDTRSTVMLGEGVRDVEIDYSPFYVFSTPNNTSKIEITIVQEGEPVDDEAEEDEDLEPEEQPEE